MLGTVTSFEDERGLGTVEAAGSSAPATFGFHCTAIAGGSRKIDVGARVAFVAVPAIGGRREAAGITPLTLA
jgi:cold shock CspA family protein